MPPKKAIKSVSNTENNRRKRKKTTLIDTEPSTSGENQILKRPKLSRSDSPNISNTINKSRKRKKTSIDTEPSTSGENQILKRNKLSPTVSPNIPTENEFTPIAHLNPFQTDWTIKCRVVVKRPIYTWENAKSKGKLFSMDLMDASAEVRVTIFQHLVDKFFDKFSQNKIYTISDADIKSANKKYSSLKNNFEIFFNDDTKIEECVNDLSSIPKISYKFTPISKLKKSEKDRLVTVIGICHEIKTLDEFTSKSSGKELKKKDFTLIDNSKNGKILLFL